ncbi:GtrA family protein [Sediminispirochaeta bajacaliforniensis]|uniref:GtrA family protein n=1 Tax=Sediminispirochaeta bajacaliforniensis TaxID=148 RepID=UPI000362F0AE|nr:GtrA family protein [Sediminispirochaeta bajacaliforniensis]
MGSKNKALIRQILSFNIIGVVNTLVTYGIYSAFVSLGLHYSLALVLEYCFGVTFSFFMNKHFTFAHKEKTSAAMFGRMVGSYIVVLGVNWLLLRWCIEGFGLSEYFGQFIALSISVLFSFFLQKFFVFVSSRRKA